MKKLFILFATVALVAAFTLPATAADAEWGFYGNARMSTFYNDRDGGDAGADSSFTTWTEHGNSRIGANVKAGAIAGRFEYGFNTSDTTMRLLYGTWDFGGGKLLVGQTYCPTMILYSNQVWDQDVDLITTGGAYLGRRPQLRLTMGGFQVALIEVTGDQDLGTDGGTEVLLPKLEVAYSMKAGPASFKVSGGAMSYTADPDGVNEDISAYLASLGVKFGFGPVTLGVSGFYGQNTGDYGLSGGSTAALNTAGGLEDATSMGGVLIANFKASDTLSFEVGGGYAMNESDITEDDDKMSVYGNAVVHLAPGFFVVPEVGMVDYGDNSSGVDEGDQIYVGAKWQINF